MSARKSIYMFSLAFVLCSVRAIRLLIETAVRVLACAGRDAQVRHGVVLCLCLAFFVSPAAAALSQLEFQRVLAKYRETATRASEVTALLASFWVAMKCIA